MNFTYIFKINFIAKCLKSRENTTMITYAETVLHIIKKIIYPPTSQQSGIVFVLISLVHIIVVSHLFMFGLLRFQDDIMLMRKKMEEYLTDSRRIVLFSTMPEFLLFPPLLISFLLGGFYTSSLYGQMLDTTSEALIAKQRRYARHSLVAPFPHLVFVAFFTVDGFIIVQAMDRGYPTASKIKSYFLTIMYVGSTFNAIYVVAFFIYYPPLINYRRDLVRAEQRLLEETRDKLQSARVLLSKPRPKPSHKP